jgi:hypothetical protein
MCEEESYIKELFKGIGNILAIKFIHIDKYYDRNLDKNIWH